MHKALLRSPLGSVRFRNTASRKPQGIYRSKWARGREPGRGLKRTALTGLALLALLAISAQLPSPSPTLINMTPTSSQSYEVQRLLGSGRGAKFGGSVVLIELPNVTYDRLPSDFGVRINATLKRVYGAYSTLDYFTLKKKIYNTLDQSMTKYIVANFKYVKYLKDLTEQLDGIGIYVYEATSDAWTVYKELKNVNVTYAQYREFWNSVASEVNDFERSFVAEEERCVAQLPTALYSAERLLNESKAIISAFSIIRKYYTEAYYDLLKGLRELCEGKGNVRDLAVRLGEGEGLKGAVRRLLSQAFLYTVSGWNGPLCNGTQPNTKLVKTVLGYFVSLVPNSLSSYYYYFNLTEGEMRNVALLATALSPNATEGEVYSAVSEVLRGTLALDLKTASLVLKAVEGDERAVGELVVEFLSIEDECLKEAIIRSITTDVPFTVLATACEKEGVSEVLRARGAEGVEAEDVIAGRGMGEDLVRYASIASLAKRLEEHSIPSNFTVSLLFGKARPEEVLRWYLKAKGVLYPNCIYSGVVHSKSFVEAEKRSALCVFKRIASVMERYGFSKSAVDSLIYSIVALGPGLSEEQIRKIVLRTILSEAAALNDPRLELLKSLTNITSVLRLIVWSDTPEEALSNVRSILDNITQSFMLKYVATELLVGRDKKHLIFVLNKDVPEPVTLADFKSYVISPSIISNEIKTATMTDIDTVNKVGALLVLLALVLSVRSLRVALLPVFIIYIVLQYYKIVVALVGQLGVKPSNIDMVIATATILGMGIDYSLYTVANYRRDLIKSMKPVLIAATMASLGFVAFGAVSAFTLPGLSTLGVFVPLAILFTAVVGPLITVVFKDVLGIGPERAKPSVPILTALSIDMPKTTFLVSLILILSSIYVVVSVQPGYDLYLFLPQHSSATRALVVLQNYSSPGVLGPTVVMLHMSADDLSEVAKEVESLSRYFLESGKFDYVFAYTRPLGRFVSEDPEVLELVGGNQYLRDGWCILYLLPSSPPDSGQAVNAVKELRSFLSSWIRGKNFDRVLVGGQSAMNYDIAVTVNEITFNYVIPIMIIVTIATFVTILRRTEMVVAASINSVAALLVAMGVSALLITKILNVTLLWVVIPLVVTVVLSVGSDYSVFYFFGLKEAVESCKILEDGDCASKMNALNYNSSRMYKLILGFATTFSVAYLAFLVSNIWALKEIAIALGLVPIILTLSLFTLVPAFFSLIWKE